MAKQQQWNQNYAKQKQDGANLGHISSAYNFVPLSEQIVFPDWADKVSHDKPFAKGLCGSLELKIENHTPLLIGEQVNGEVKPFRLPDGCPAIPGSSLRGMIRNVLEIASFGKMRYVDDKRYGVRDLQANFYKQQLTHDDGGRRYTPNSQAGWLNFENDEWVITPCKMARVERYMLEKYFGEKSWVKISNKDRPESDEKYKKWLQAGKSLSIDFDDEGLAYHSHSKGKIQLHYNKVKKVGLGDKQGSLVFTGQPGPQKHLEFIFYQEESVHNFVVPQSIIQGFQHIYQDSKHWKYLKQANLFSQGFPVFYLTSGSKISSLGLSQMYRLAYKNSVGELIDKANSDHRVNNKLDLAELIFGTVDEQDGQQSLKGRVNFAHARCEQVQPKTEQCEAILNSPKPTYYPNYIVQNQENGQLKGRDYQTFMDNAAQIRGWKRYPARAENHIAIPKVDTRQNQAWVALHPITDTASFNGKLRFHNLLPIELGAIAWCLSWGYNDLLRHAIGMGKPFGFGQIKISITEHDIMPNQVDGECSIENCISQFTDYMSQELAQDWIYSEQIQQLMAMADPMIASEQVVPLIPLDLEGGGKNNQFVLAKKKDLVLAPYIKAKPPTLSADREWLDKTLTELAQSTKSTPEKVLFAKGLAAQWQMIEEPGLKQKTKALIKQQWGDWWDEPNGRSMITARKIYEENG